MASEVGGEVETEALVEEEPEEPADEELLEEDDLGIDDLVAEDLVDDEDLEDVPVPAAVTTDGEEALVEVEEDEEEEDDDDVEASLDVILKERLVVADEEGDEEDDGEPTDAEDRADGATRVLPKQPGEFVCLSCFLVKNETQLADRERMYCRDCV